MNRKTIATIGLCAVLALPGSTMLAQQGYAPAGSDGTVLSTGRFVGSDGTKMVRTNLTSVRITSPSGVALDLTADTLKELKSGVVTKLSNGVEITLLNVTGPNGELLYDISIGAGRKIRLLVDPNTGVITIRLIRQ